MISQKQMEKYAEMLLKMGVNLQRGQELVVNASIECAPLVRTLARQAYGLGAKEVQVNWADAEYDRLRYEYMDEETLTTVHDWKAEALNSFARRGCAYISICSDAPDAFAGVDAGRMAMARAAMNQATEEAVTCRMTGIAPWLVAAYPGARWAQKVFPGLSETEAVDRLWEAILYASRGSAEDPCLAWQQHQENLNRRMRWLNAQQFVTMHYVSSNGTDFTVGMPEHHIWTGGGAPLKNGLGFIPNMPTEEVFSAPDRNRADGTLVAALPLSHAGTLIRNFKITFRDGRVVDYDAEIGKEALRGIIETDEGSHHLGEIALIPTNSPIAEMGVLFYNTLFDENASCHFALGRAYPDCLEGGEEMTKEELLAAGLNDSLTHVDFMVGSPDLCITGIKADGTEVSVFENGRWAEGAEA